MAKNKKAQILAAVMCAATVAGVSPAISSADSVESGIIAESSQNGNNVAVGAKSEIKGNVIDSVAIGKSTLWGGNNKSIAINGQVFSDRDESIAIGGNIHGSYSIAVGNNSWIFNLK